MRPGLLLPSLSIGIVLGALACWRFPSLFPTRPGLPHSAQTPPPAGVVQLPAWDWRVSPTPPPLADDAAHAAIAAWINLRGPDGQAADFATRAHSLHGLLAYLPLTAYPRVLDALVPFSGSADRDLLGIVFNLYVDRDPASATRWAIAAPAGDDFYPRWQAMLAIQSWASRDVSAASAWVRSLGDPELMRELASPLLAELAKTDPISALQTFGPELWNDGSGFHALREPLLSWARRDPASALSWLLAQPIIDPSRANYGWMIDQITPPEQAPAMVKAISVRPAFGGQDKMLASVLTVWAKARPAEVLAWVQALPDASQRTSLLGELSGSDYSGRDKTSPEFRLNFTLALPGGRNREQKIGRIIGEWAKQDPSAALTWMRAQNDPGVTAAAPQAQAAILGVIARDEPATAVAEWHIAPPIFLDTGQ